MKNRWSQSDRQAYADGARNRAYAVPSRRSDGPDADEWDWENDDEGF